MNVQRELVPNGHRALESLLIKMAIWFLAIVLIVVLMVVLSFPESVRFDQLGRHVKALVLQNPDEIL